MLAPHDAVHEKMLGNVQEVKARGGIVIAFTDRASKELTGLADYVYTVPRANPFVTALLLAVPLQLFAYHVADARGNDVDQPRNLAKSVTVE